MKDLLAKIKHKYHNFDITRRHLNRVVNEHGLDTSQLKDLIMK